jgi:hypothetical protein
VLLHRDDGHHEPDKVVRREPPLGTGPIREAESWNMRGSKLENQFQVSSILLGIDTVLLEESGYGPSFPFEQQRLVPLSEAQGQVPLPTKPRTVNGEMVLKRNEFVASSVRPWPTF